jgi:hypothetical protein
MEPLDTLLLGIRYRGIDFYWVSYLANLQLALDKSLDLLFIFCRRLLIVSDNGNRRLCGLEASYQPSRASNKDIIVNYFICRGIL